MQVVTPEGLMQERGLTRMTREVWWQLTKHGWQLIDAGSDGSVVLALDGGFWGVIYREVECEAQLFTELVAEMERRRNAEAIATRLANEAKLALMRDRNFWKSKEEK